MAAKHKSIEPCEGCRDDFYNAKNGIGVKRCWKLESARIETRWKHGWWEDPTTPGAFVEVKTYSCHHEPGRFAFSKELPSFAVDPVRIGKARK